jgi:hypothetical protein
VEEETNLVEPAVASAASGGGIASIGAVQIVANDARRHQRPSPAKNASVSAFPYVCPEPVLVK